MKFKQLFVILLTVISFSCANNSRNNLAPFLNESLLSSQLFTVNINNDTTLLTKNGCVINIQKGSLESNSENVKLEIKEALSTTDIVLAGLTTMSGTKTLTSGGMIYFNAANGYNISIKKNIEILVPTENYNPDMKIYKGIDSAGKINWTNPESLPKDSTLTAIENGKQLFMANCSNCHKVAADFTGPGLIHSTKYLPKQWIYNFIRNPAQANDPYSILIKKQWKPTLMTSFPQLQPYDIDNILAYVQTAYDKGWNDVAPYNFSHLKDSDCIDSCTEYMRTIQNLDEERLQLRKNNDEFFTLDRTIQLPATVDTTPVNVQSSASPDIPVNNSQKVQPTSIKATFYTINVNTTGWYNIDVLLEEDSNVIPSQLFVNLQANVNTEFSISLIIPSAKIFTEGGKLENNNQYGFFETNGKTLLPQKTECYIIVIGEADGKLLFGKTRFISQKTQTIDVILTQVIKTEIASQIKALNLDNVDMEIKNAPNADKFRIIEQKTNEAEKLRPKNCDCGWPEQDSSKAPLLPLALLK